MESSASIKSSSAPTNRQGGAQSPSSRYSSMMGSSKGWPGGLRLPFVDLSPRVWNRHMGSSNGRAAKESRIRGWIEEVLGKIPRWSSIYSLVPLELLPSSLGFLLLGLHLLGLHLLRMSNHRGPVKFFLSTLALYSRCD